VLPKPPEGKDIKDAVRASLRLLEVAPDAVTFPILAAVYRAAIGSADFSIHLTGPTGQGKTELAARAQQHYGETMDARHLPANWSSTANALESIAFVAKDAVLVMDDFSPQGSQLDIQRSQTEADRVFRAQGNISGRLRLRADASLRSEKPPRGLVLSTGEDIPRGHSLRARLLIVYVPPAEVKWPLMTACQSDARTGLYAAAMSGYIRWMARRYDNVQRTMRRVVPKLREQLEALTRHHRTAEIAANLLFGVRAMLVYAIEVGAITKAEGESLFKRGLSTFTGLAASQTQYQRASDPVERFLDFLKAAIASGRAHVANKHGGPPSGGGALGCRLRGSGEFAELQPVGDRVGWLVDGDLFLEPHASFAAAQRIARDMGETIAVCAPTQHRRLRDRGVLVTVDLKRQELTVRRTLEGIRRKVLHVRANALVILPVDNPPFPPGQ
jgi:hypothetical protein